MKPACILYINEIEILYFRITEQPRETTTTSIDIYDETTTTFPANPLEFECHGKREGRYKHPRNCHFYFKCSYEGTRVVSCHDDLFFDDKKRLCTTIEELTLDRRKECYLL